jgi:hypothetical protein
MEGIFESDKDALAFSARFETSCACQFDAAFRRFRAGRQKEDAF